MLILIFFLISNRSKIVTKSRHGGSHFPGRHQLVGNFFRVRIFIFLISNPEKPSQIRKAPSAPHFQDVTGNRYLFILIFIIRRFFTSIIRRITGIIKFATCDTSSTYSYLLSLVQNTTSLRWYHHQIQHSHNSFCCFILVQKKRGRYFYCEIKLGKI